MSWLKSWIRPAYGTVAFQPFALLWCWVTGADYWTFVGPFTIYSMFAFVPIYHVYDLWWASKEKDKQLNG